MASEATVPLSGPQTVRAGAALVLNSGSNIILGLLYWVIAARSTTPEELGLGSTLVSTLLVVSLLAQLNYSRSLPYLIPRAAGDGTRLLAHAYARALLASALLGGAFWLIVNQFHPANVPALSLRGGAVFVVGTMLWSVFSMQDAALVAFRLTTVIPVENTLFGVSKIVGLLALPLVIVSGAWVIALSWIAPLFLLVLGVNYIIFVRHRVEGHPVATPRGPAAAGLVDGLGGYSMIISPLILQYVVLTNFGAASAAILFIPRALVGSADALWGNVGNAITAEVTRNAGRLSPQIRRFIIYPLGAAAVGALLLLVIGKPLLHLFGERYSQSSLTLLICFGFAAVARAAVFCTAAVQRARGALVRTMLLQFTLALGPLLAAILVELQLMRLSGVGVVWLVTSIGGLALSLHYARANPGPGR